MKTAPFKGMRVKFTHMDTNQMVDPFREVDGQEDVIASHYVGQEATVRQNLTGKTVDPMQQVLEVEFDDGIRGQLTLSEMEPVYTSPDQYGGYPGFAHTYDAMNALMRDACVAIRNGDSDEAFRMVADARDILANCPR